MRRRLSTGALAQRSARHPWLTIGAWGAALVAAVFLIATFLGDALTTEADVTSKPESRAAELLVEERMPSAADEPDEVLVVRSAEHSVDDPAFRARIETLLAEAAQYGARPTASYYADGDKSLVSADRDTMAVPLAFSDDSDENVEGVVDLVSGARGEGGFETAMTGSLTADLDFNTAAEEDLQRGEMFGIGIALIVLLLVFGAVVASLLPILLALVSIVVALGVTALIGAGFELSFFVVNMLVMMGLAVGIDYSLFVVSRYREERGKGVEKMEAITASGLTASRAVFFSGITVVLALVGMFLVPSTIFRSLAVGAIVVVLVAVAAALTLLPAVLRLVGDRIDALRIPFVRRPAEGGFWARVARAVMRRPVVSLVASVAVLVAATVPFAGINTGFAGVSTLPASFESKRGYELLAEELGYGTAPAEIVIDGDIGTSAVQAGIDRLETSLASEEGFGRPELEVNDAGNLAVLTVLLDGDESSNQATESVATLRDDLVPDAFAGVPAEVLVGGGTAENVDFFAITDRYLPIVVAFVLGLSFLLLAVAFRSLVVPATSILMNLLSVGAAFGLLVLVFQEGIGAGLFGFEQVETIEAWIPLFLFTVLFGLSMDYHVFLLSRIRERYDQTGDNTGSIAFGVATTARIITGAALIMVAVFGGFAAGQLVMFQQMGFGLGVAVLLDATIVRSVLVPATMRLLGDRNWYLPRRLEWLPDLRIEAPRANPAREHGSS
jgi:putative drug exporter of the RND superfamily